MKTRILQILGVAIVATIGMVSCDTDACKEVTCDNGGQCVDGDCVCDDGYEGTTCDVLWREGMTGTVSLSGTVSCDVSAGGNFPATATTITNGSSDLKIVVNVGGNLALICTMTSTSSFTVDSQTLNTYTYTGSGNLNGTTFTLNLTEADPSVPEDCIYNLTGTL